MKYHFVRSTFDKVGILVQIISLLTNLDIVQLNKWMEHSAVSMDDLEHIYNELKQDIDMLERL